MPFDRERYLTLKAAGLCVRCKDDAKPGRVYCQPCRTALDRQAQATKAERRDRMKRRRLSAGLCAHCGEREREWASDKLGRWCAECRVAAATRWRRNYCKPGGVNRCSKCGQKGHKRPTCPRLYERMAPLRIDDYATAREERGAA